MTTGRVTKLVLLTLAGLALIVGATLTPHESQTIMPSLEAIRGLRADGYNRLEKEEVPGAIADVNALVGEIEIPPTATEQQRERFAAGKRQILESFENAAQAFERYLHEPDYVEKQKSIRKSLEAIEAILASTRDLDPANTLHTDDADAKLQEFYWRMQKLETTCSWLRYEGESPEPFTDFSNRVTDPEMVHAKKNGSPIQTVSLQVKKLGSYAQIHVVACSEDGRVYGEAIYQIDEPAIKDNHFQNCVITFSPGVPNGPRASVILTPQMGAIDAVKALRDCIGRCASQGVRIAEVFPEVEADMNANIQAGVLRTSHPKVNIVGPSPLRPVSISVAR